MILLLGQLTRNSAKIRWNIYVINGPNINLLGTREPEIYGKETLKSISKKCIQQGLKDGHEVKFMQSNYEGEIVEWIQNAITEKV